MLLVANAGSDSLTLIDPISLSSEEISLILDNEIEGSVGTHEIFQSRNKAKVYTVNAHNNSVYRVDIEDKKIENVAYVGKSPAHMDVYQKYIYVTNEDSNSISVVDEEKFRLVENIPAGEKPHGIRIDKIRKKMYIANSNECSISIFDLNTLKEKKIYLSESPYHIYLSYNKVYVLSFMQDNLKKSCLTFFDKGTMTVIKKIYLNSIVVDMVPLDDDIIFTTDLGDGYLYKINLSNNDTVDKYYIGGMPNNMIWDEENILFITDIKKNQLIFFNYKTNEIEEIIKTGKEPSDIIFYRVTIP